VLGVPTFAKVESRQNDASRFHDQGGTRSAIIEVLSNLNTIPSREAAAECRCAVQIALCVSDHASIGKTSVLSVKTVKYSEGLRLR
jgi:hypothetical protein